jgi:hypothetical protein
MGFLVHVLYVIGPWHVVQGSPYHHFVPNLIGWRR